MSTIAPELEPLEIAPALRDGDEAERRDDRQDEPRRSLAHHGQSEEEPTTQKVDALQALLASAR